MTKGYFLKIISKFRVFTFKYNKCIGSICLVINASTPRSYLNTTNVSVQFNIIAKKLGKKDNLNTTNVSVQFLLYLHLSHNLLLFKYNKCIGSIGELKKEFRSYVRFKYNKCIGSIVRF